LARTGNATDRVMSAFDASLFRGDQHPRMRSALLAAAVLEHSPGRDRFAEAFDRASRVITRLRQHVVAPPVATFLPSWIVDPDFDLNYHLRVVQLRAPGSMQELLDFVQAELMAPLDLARPLWTATLIEGLDGGRAACVFKMGHAVTDGVGAQRLFAALYDDEPGADRGPLPPEPIPEDVTPGDLLQEALARLPREAARALDHGGRSAAAFLQQLLADPQGTVANAAGYIQGFRGVFAARGEPSPALRGRSLSRRAIAFEMPLAALKRVSKAAGGSINDAYLAAIAGSLRVYHERLGSPVQTVPVAVPVNLRAEDDLEAGNRFGGVMFGLPVGVVDPEERIGRIRELVRDGRANPAIGAMEWMAPVLARLPDVALEALSGQMAGTDLQISNVPGSPATLYLAGAKVLKVLPFGPLPGIAGMFTMNSLAGECFVGFSLDPAAFRQPGAMADALVLGFEEVLQLGGGKAHITRPVLGRAPGVRSRG
jgi:diacylglycerol O-acyltransferase / wax synthase